MFAKTDRPVRHITNIKHADMREKEQIWVSKDVFFIILTQKSRLGSLVAQGNMGSTVVARDAGI